MFCNRCGAPVETDFNVCPRCGAPLQPGVPALTRPNRLERHIRTLGILWIVVGVLLIMPSLVLAGISHASHIMIGDEIFTNPLMRPLLFFLGSGFLVVAAGGILVGWGLMRHEHWARIAAIVVGILALFHVPFGTALGIYTLWVLLPADARAQYERLSRT